MDRESAKRLAKKVAANITQELLAQRVTPLTVEEVSELLNKTLENVFIAFEENDRKLIYNELSIQFHSDKFKLTHPQLFAYLYELKLSNLPQQILNLIKEQSEQYFQIVRFKEQYKQEKALQTTIGNFFKYIFSNPKDALTILQTRWFDNPLVRDLERYIQPFYFFAYAIFFCSIAILGIATLARFVISAAMSTTIAMANSFMRQIFETLTNGQYVKLIDEYTQTNLDTLKSTYTKALRKTAIDAIIDSIEGDEQYRFEQAFTIVQASNDEFLKRYVQQQVIEMFDFGLAIDELETILLDDHLKKIRNTISGLERLRFIFVGFYQALKQPLDDRKLTSIALRLTQAVAAFIVLPAVVFSELAELVRAGLNYTASALIVGAHYAILVALDLPLKAYDLWSFANQCFSSKVKRNNSPNNEERSLNNSQSLVVLFNNSGKATKEATKELPPLHFSSPTATSKAQDPIISNFNAVKICSMR